MSSAQSKKLPPGKGADRGTKRKEPEKPKENNEQSVANENLPECGICLDTIKLEGKPDSCGHEFCFSCLDTWSKTANVCPMCKRQFHKIIKKDLQNPNRKSSTVKVKNTDRRRANAIAVESIFPTSSHYGSDSDETSDDEIHGLSENMWPRLQTLLNFLRSPGSYFLQPQVLNRPMFSQQESGVVDLTQDDDSVTTTVSNNRPTQNRQRSTASFNGKSTTGDVTEVIDLTQDDDAPKVTLPAQHPNNIFGPPPLSFPFPPNYQPPIMDMPLFVSELPSSTSNNQRLHNPTTAPNNSRVTHTIPFTLPPLPSRTPTFADLLAPPSPPLILNTPNQQIDLSFSPSFDSDDNIYFETKPADKVVTQS